jgi:hypothetical protein
LATIGIVRQTIFPKEEKNMNKKLMVGALAVALIGGGAVGATMLPSTNAASSVGTTGATAPSVQSPVQPANDQETNDDAVTGTQAAVDQETNDDGGVQDAQDAQDAQGNDLETNDDTAQATK